MHTPITGPPLQGGNRLTGLAMRERKSFPLSNLGMMGSGDHGAEVQKATKELRLEEGRISDTGSRKTTSGLRLRGEEGQGAVLLAERVATWGPQGLGQVVRAGKACTAITHLSSSPPEHRASSASSHPAGPKMTERVRSVLKQFGECMGVQGPTMQLSRVAVFTNVSSPLIRTT